MLHQTDTGVTVAGWPLGGFMMNTWLAAHEASREAVIVDAGGDCQPVIDRVAREGLTVTGILMTHAHIDHMEGLSRLMATYPAAPVYFHPEETFWLDNLPMQAAYFRYPVTPQAPPPDHVTWVQHDDTLDLGPLSCRVLWCPGHTPGGVAFWMAQHALLFTGDILFRRSIGRSDFPRGDGPQLVAAIKQHLWPLPDETVVMSGHGPLTTIGDERAQNPYVR
jgi:hydroxyacylglutathione hydrolase